VATYTAALISDTAVPAWHDGFRVMPFVFAASAVSSAAGLGLMAAPAAETGPVRLLGVAAGAAELATEAVMERRMGIAQECFRVGKAKTYGRLARGLLVTGVVGTLLAGRRRAPAALSGVCLLAGSALTRWAIFEAGTASTLDPRYTVLPQRERLEQRQGHEREGSHG
ncbi:MAG: NrfD/PsrC family molybdoenzyme membrane anchor subunit, partial [Acidimicrobiales bacterium]